MSWLCFHDISLRFSHGAPRSKSVRYRCPSKARASRVTSCDQSTVIAFGCCDCFYTTKLINDLNESKWLINSFKSEAVSKWRTPPDNVVKCVDTEKGPVLTHGESAKVVAKIPCCCRRNCRMHPDLRSILDKALVRAVSVLNMVVLSRALRSWLPFSATARA